MSRVYHYDSYKLHVHVVFVKSNLPRNEKTSKNLSFCQELAQILRQKIYYIVVVLGGKDQRLFAPYDVKMSILHNIFMGENLLHYSTKQNRKKIVSSGNINLTLLFI